MVNSYVIDSPQPSNISYWWNFGSLLGLCLVIQIITGVTLAMHVRCGNNAMSWDLIPFVPFLAIVSSELGITESVMLNIASQPEVGGRRKPISNDYTARHNYYDETHTSQTTITTASKLRGALVGYRGLTLLSKCSACLLIEGESTGSTTSTIKVMGVASKVVVRTLTLNTGLPKGRNSYGNGSTVVPGVAPKRLRYDSSNIGWKGSVEASLLFKRTYVSGGDTGLKSNVGLKLNKLLDRSRSGPDQVIDRNLYNILSSVEMLTYAYENIKSKPGNMPPGVSPETLDGISKEKLEQLSALLKSEKFKFAPSRRIGIGKPSGGTRPLTIAAPMDKIVQEAMRLILEAIFEPLFKDCSHGFRPNRSCHTALKRVSQEFQPAQWFIEGDISKCFDSIPHDKLMKLIEDKITDRSLTKLIWKALTAGYLDFQIFKSNIIGTPQGSIISPILSNIFLDQLDHFVLSLKKDFDKGDKAIRTKESRYYEYHVLKARKAGDKALMRKHIAERSQFRAIDFGNDGFKRLSYIRYADDWIVGIRGTLQEAKEILNKISLFCASIGLTVSESKTKITAINTDPALFLGTSISRSNHRSHSKMGTMRRLRRNNLGLRFEAPLDRINKKLSQAKFMVNGKSAPKFLWLHNDHDQIIVLYNSVLRGYLNYYSFTHNYGRLATYLEYILKQSCAKLLATKFTLGTMAQTYKKFGHRLTSPKGKTFFKPSYRATYKYMVKPNPVVGALSQEKTNATLEYLRCKNCDSDYRVEFHHIRAMKDLNPKISNMDRLMVKANRKRIPLCIACHMMKHRKRETVFDQTT